MNSEEHGELPFDICENFSDNEFNAADIHKEVEFTVALVSLTETEPNLLDNRGQEVNESNILMPLFCFCR